MAPEGTAPAPSGDDGYWRIRQATTALDSASSRGHFPEPRDVDSLRTPLGPLTGRPSDLAAGSAHADTLRVDKDAPSSVEPCGVFVSQLY